MRQLLSATLLLSLLAATPARAQVGQTQSVVAGGGGASTQTTLRLDGTVGQTGVGPSSGGTFSLEAGFHVRLDNQSPLNSVPGAQATDEDTALVFSAASALSVSDPDAGPSAQVKVTLTATNGTLTLGGTSGLTFTPAGADNDGTADAQAAFTGNLGDVNAALNNLTFDPPADFNGPASLTLQTDDLGHHGEGGGKTDTDTVDITVNAVNDRPTAAGQSLSTDEEVALGVTLSGSDTETAAASLTYAVTAQPAHGTLSGTAPSLTYTPFAGYAGPDGFKFTVTDAGDGASPPLTSAEAVVSITVASMPDIYVRDARAAEPKSGETQMLFVVTLERAAASPVTLSYATSAEPAGAGKATVGGDFETASGTLTFQPGQRVQTVAVTVLADNDKKEPDETFLLQLSDASGGRIPDASATGTIMAANPAGAILISELRAFGPGAASDPRDEFVEIYNNSDEDVTVQTADGSDGWGLFQTGADCDSTPALVGFIPNETVIPARGHYLLTGSAYSLGAYAEGDGEMSADIGPHSNLALFSTTDVANLGTDTRLDAVGLGGLDSNNCALLREGGGPGELETNLAALGQYSFFRKLCGFVQGVGCDTQGTPKDTGDNASDFIFGDVNGTPTGAGQRLAAPGPENSTSPVKHDDIPLALLDSTAAAASSPNRVRDLTPDPDNHAKHGTLSVRRRVVNRTGRPVTRLRFRVSELTTFPVPNGTADMRALSSSPFKVTVKDAGTCRAMTGTASNSCEVTVQGTTLEHPPDHPAGGGLNATLAVGTVALDAPLGDGQSVLVQFLLGVEQNGLFRFYIVLEALP